MESFPTFSGRGGLVNGDGLASDAAAAAYEKEWTRQTKILEALINKASPEAKERLLKKGRDGKLLYPCLDHLQVIAD